MRGPDSPARGSEELCGLDEEQAQIAKQVACRRVSEPSSVQSQPRSTAYERVPLRLVLEQAAFPFFIIPWQLRPFTMQQSGRIQPQQPVVKEERC